MSTSEPTPHQERLAHKQQEMRRRQRKRSNVAAYTEAKRELRPEQREKIRRRVAAHVLLCRGVSVEEIADRLNVPARTIVEWDRLGRPLL